MSDNYLAWKPDPSRPSYTPPPGAVDAHCHVFGPVARFPFAPERKYTPVDASKEQLFALRDHLGLSRNVIVQATCHGRDNSALLDALVAANGKARGVAIIDETTTDAELEQLNRDGVRGVRFNFLKRLVDPTPHAVFRRIAARIYELGWHVVVYFDSEELEDVSPLIAELPGVVVVDHMGRPNVAAGTTGAGFTALLNLMSDNERIWVKTSCPERLTLSGPPYSDITPFARTLVERFPNRVLWGTDWPHPNMRSHMPDDGALVDLIPEIAPTEALRQALLIDNPTRLYWPEEAV